LPTDLIHHIDIAAPAEKMYRAITTGEGIKVWWTKARFARPSVQGKGLL
jgi:uncharacterized protein YndB with AHSA1/START domain